MTGIHTVQEIVHVRRGFEEMAFRRAMKILRSAIDADVSIERLDSRLWSRTYRLTATGSARDARYVGMALNAALGGKP